MTGRRLGCSVPGSQQTALSLPEGSCSVLLLTCFTVVHTCPVCDLWTALWAIRRAVPLASWALQPEEVWRPGLGLESQPDTCRGAFAGREVESRG